MALVITKSERLLKRALATGEWRRHPEWRVFVIGDVGGLIVALGVVSTILVVEPPAVNLVVGGWAIYAMICLTIAFARA